MFLDDLLTRIDGIDFPPMQNIGKWHCLTREFPSRPPEIPSGGSPIGPGRQPANQTGCGILITGGCNPQQGGTDEDRSHNKGRLGKVEQTSGVFCYERKWILIKTKASTVL